MPGPIQTPAFGLPNLLGLKGQQAPQQLAEAIAGIVDMRDLYLLSTRESIFLNQVAVPASGVNSFGNPSNGLVPSGELWYVWGFALNCSTGVGVTGRIRPYLLQQTGNGVPLCNPAMSLVASETGRVPADKPFWAGQGDSLAALIEVFAGAIVISGSAIITRLRV